MEHARNQIRGYSNPEWKGFNSYKTALAYVSSKHIPPQVDPVAKKAAEEKVKREAEVSARKAADEKAKKAADDKARKAAPHTNGSGEVDRLKAQLDKLVLELADAESEVTDKLFAYEWAKGNRERVEMELESVKASIKALEVVPPKPVVTNPVKTIVKLREQDLPRPVPPKPNSNAHAETWFVVKDVAYEDRAEAKKNSCGAPIHITHSRIGFARYCREMWRSNASYVLREKPNASECEQLSYLNDHGMRIYQVFTDGACANNGTDYATGGIGVYFGKDNPMNVSKPLEGYTQTNQRAELAAVKAAFEIIGRMKICKPYEINTDSTYVINCLTKWCYNWERNGWKNEGGFDVGNQDLLKDIMALQRNPRGQNVTFKKVKAHSHLEGNDEADRLAQDGICMSTIRHNDYI